MIGTMPAEQDTSVVEQRDTALRAPMAEALAAPYHSTVGCEAFHVLVRCRAPIEVARRFVFSVMDAPDDAFRQPGSRFR